MNWIKQDVLLTSSVLTKQTEASLKAGSPDISYFLIMSEGWEDLCPPVLFHCVWTHISMSSFCPNTSQSCNQQRSIMWFHPTQYYPFPVFTHLLIEPQHQVLQNPKSYRQTLFEIVEVNIYKGKNDEVGFTHHCDEGQGYGRLLTCFTLSVCKDA